MKQKYYIILIRGDSMKRINIGVLGSGFMGKTHTFGYKTIPLYYEKIGFCINLKGVCASHIKNAEALKNKAGFEYATDNFYDLINDELIVAKGIVEKSLDNKWLVEVCREFLFHYFQAD